MPLSVIFSTMIKKTSTVMKQVLLSAIFSIILAGAFAQSETPRADVRQTKQRARIHEGRKSGEVTNGEAAMLNKQQRHIRRSERRAEADGTVTAREKRKLEKKQDRANRHIRRAKNNPVDNN